MNKTRIFIIVAILGAVSFSAAFWARKAADTETTEIPPVIDAAGNEVPGSVASLEKVTLGSVDQWILIRAQDTTKPVLLILHGGPGGSQMPWVELFQPAELEMNFMVVHWDQCGAGKSFDAALTTDDLQIDDFVADTLELTGLLRERFGQDKIFLTGHSWDSALGFYTLMENSEHLHAYIPSGERVHWTRSHTESLAWIKKQAQAANDSEVLQLIENIDPFDATKEEHLALVYQGQENTAEATSTPKVFGTSFWSMPSVDNARTTLNLISKTIFRGWKNRVRRSQISLDHTTCFPISHLPQSRCTS